jgi:parvulin-like peptidyl-prolyl isomerase
MSCILHYKRKKELRMLKIFSSFIIIILFSISAYAENIIVAKVNGTALTKKDLDTELDRLIPQITFHRNVSPEKRKYYYGKAIEEIVAKELQFQDALAKGIKNDKGKVEAQTEKFKKRFKSKEAFKAALDKEGLTEDQLQANIEKEMLVQAVIARTVTEPAQINEAELKEYYEKNLSKFKQPETMRLRLISTKDEKKSKDIFAKLKDGDDFGDLAYNMSEDDYRVKSGDIGYVHKGRMLPEIEDAASKLKAGEMSGPFSADNKWYIIKLEDRKPEKLLSFEGTKVKLKKELEAERAKELKKKWMEDLKAKAKIEVLLKTEE